MSDATLSCSCPSCAWSDASRMKSAPSRAAPSAPAALAAVTASEKAEMRSWSRRETYAKPEAPPGAGAAARTAWLRKAEAAST
eukprot:scaffold20209_cov112-Isochrysis_galbana.AAC.2